MAPVAYHTKEMLDRIVMRPKKHHLQPEAEEEEKVDINFEEDDTPVTDGELAKKTGKGK